MSSDRRPRHPTVDVHLGGRCSLSCAVCDCRAGNVSLPEIGRALADGGDRATLRSADGSRLLEPVVRMAAGFGEIRVRTSALPYMDPAAAERLRGLGVRAALVPFFDHRAEVHDRVAGRRGALVGALVGIRALAGAGLAIDLEIPLLASQEPARLVELCARAVERVRSVRFYSPAATLPADLAPPRWSVLAPSLARALDRCAELGIRAVADVPICALRDHPETQERAMKFDVRGRKAKADRPAPCRSCTVARQCGGPPASYRALHGDADLVPYAARPRALFAAQRTTPEAKWTEARVRAAKKASLSVLRPTVNCNQDCVFCSANETSNQIWEDPAQMMRTIVRQARAGVRQVSFGGGEPTLSKHLVDFVSAASRLGIPDVDIVTNAVLLSRPERVQQLKAAGLTKAFVSLHAHDEELSRSVTLKAGDFEKTLGGIHNLLSAGVAVTINHVVNRLNFRYLSRFVEMLHGQFGGRAWLSFAFVTPQYRGLENIELVPKISEVMPYLARAMYRALELGQPFVVGSRQGIPPCFLKEFAGWSDVLMLAEESGVEDAHQKQKAGSCERCRYSEVCTGLWKPYVARHGLDELVPVPGRRFTRDDAALFGVGGVRERPTPARSFDEVPEDLRDRDGESRALSGWPLSDDAPVKLTLVRSRPVRAVLIGTGQRARHLFDAIQEAGRLAAFAVASPHAPEAEASRFAYTPAYASALEAIEDVRPECVIIASATRSHVEMARVAVAAGIPALVEKPVGGSSELVRMLAHEAGDLLIAPAHQVLYADGLERLLASGPSSKVQCIRRVRSGAPDLPRSWARGALFESLYHLMALVNAASDGRLEAVEVRHVAGSARPERIALGLRYERAASELVIEGDAPVDTLELVAGDRRWARVDGRIELTEAGARRPIERTASDAVRMLRAFADAVAEGAPMRSGLEDAARAIDATNMVLAALASAGVELSRPTEPRHAATKGLRTSYS